MSICAGLGKSCAWFELKVCLKLPDLCQLFLALLFGSEYKRKRVALLHRQLHLRANFASKKLLDISLSFPSQPCEKAPYPLCCFSKLILTLEGLKSGILGPLGLSPLIWLCYFREDLVHY